MAKHIPLSLRSRYPVDRGKGKEKSVGGREESLSPFPLLREFPINAQVREGKEERSKGKGDTFSAGESLAESIAGNVKL